MENKKNMNKGIIALLVVIIVILVVLCVLFATGTIKFKNNQQENNSIFVNTSKYYQYYISYNEHEYYSAEIELNPDGSARYRSAGTGAGGIFQIGTYQIINNKLVLSLLDENTYICGTDNNGNPNKDCYSTREYEILENDSLLNKENNQTFVSVNKANLKYMNETTNELSVDMLYGTYTWSKKYTNEYGNEINLNVKLVLNSDGTATYNASNGYDAEATKGTYKYENKQIIYTREYYNYDNQENTVYNDNNNRIETFNVIDKNTLQNTYNDQQTNLTK